MNNYILYIETQDGFCGLDFDLTFETVEQFIDWVATDSFEEYATTMQLECIELQDIDTLETVMQFSVTQAQSLVLVA